MPKRRRGILVRGGAVLLGVVMFPLLHPTPHSVASFPGANGLIAFERDAPAGDHTQTDLYTVSSDGTGVVRLNATPDRNEFGAAWDPAGERLAFWRTIAPFGTGSLWLMDGDGSNQLRLTTNIDARDPAWNPAGTRLVYQSGFDLFTLRASDGHGRQPLTSGPAWDFEPAWSPDGTRIAFTRGFEKGDVGDIYVLTVATLDVVQITDSPAYDHQVAWGPGGNRLVFERDFNGGKASIFTIKPDGSDLRRLTNGPHFDTGPAYSPDGTLIVFGSNRGNQFDMWVMDRDGGNRHRFLHRTFPIGFPDWQPITS